MSGTTDTTPKEPGEGCANTDREIWRRKPGDYYSPSIHVTAEGGIGINVSGTVIVMDVEDWFLLAMQQRGGIAHPRHSTTDSREGGGAGGLPRLTLRKLE